MMHYNSMNSMNSFLTLNKWPVCISFMLMPPCIYLLTYLKSWSTVSRGCDTLVLHRSSSRPSSALVVGIGKALTTIGVNLDDPRTGSEPLSWSLMSDNITCYTSNCTKQKVYNDLIRHATQLLSTLGIYITLTCEILHYTNSINVSRSIYIEVSYMSWY